MRWPFGGRGSGEGSGRLCRSASGGLWLDNRSTIGRSRCLAEQETRGPDGGDFQHEPRVRAHPQSILGLRKNPKQLLELLGGEGLGVGRNLEDFFLRQLN